MKKLLAVLAVIAALAAPVKADQTSETILANETGLTFNNTYVLDTFKTGGSHFTAETQYSSHTFTAASFTNGHTAAGSFTVSATTGLVRASATGSIVVASTTGISGCGVAVGGIPFVYPGYVFTEGFDWKQGTDVNSTATNLAAALTKATPYFATASPSSATITLTAKKGGALYNVVSIQSSCTSNFTITQLSGGADNASVYVNGTELRQGRDWSQNSSATTTASNIASAIVTALSPLVNATNTGGVVNIVSVQDGTTKFRNYSLKSNAANIVASGVAMTGAADPAFPYGAGGKTLKLPSHGFTTGIGLLYTKGASSPPNLTGLTAGTTYYAVIVDANNIELSDTLAHAVAGTNLITIAAGTGSDLGGNKSYNLTPQPIAGTPSFKWQQSNDNLSYSDISGTTVTISSYSNPPAEQDLVFNSSNFTMRYLRLNVTAPTAGGLFLHSQVEGFFP